MASQVRSRARVPVMNSSFILNSSVGEERYDISTDYAAFVGANSFAPTTPPTEEFRFMPCAHSGRVLSRSSALYTACWSLRRLCVQPTKQLTNSERVVGTQDFLRQRGQFRQAGGQHALFDAGHLCRKHRE